MYINVGYVVVPDDMKRHQLVKFPRNWLECTVNVYFGTHWQSNQQFLARDDENEGVPLSVTGSYPPRVEFVPFGGLAAKISKSGWIIQVNYFRVHWFKLLNLTLTYTADCTATICQIPQLILDCLAALFS